MNDSPLVAVATLPTGEVQLVDYRMPAGATHRILRAAGDDSRIVLELGDIYPPAGYNEGLKISRVSNALIEAGIVHGGAEDVLDMTDCTGVAVEIEAAHVHGRYLATIKGGSSNCSVSVLRQVGQADYTEYDLGNWFDYNRRKTTGILIAAATLENGQPARCRVLHADRPVILRTLDVVVPWWRPFFLPAMTIAKALRLA